MPAQVIQQTTNTSSQKLSVGDTSKEKIQKTPEQKKKEINKKTLTITETKDDNASIIFSYITLLETIKSTKPALVTDLKAAKFEQA